MKIDNKVTHYKFLLKAGLPVFLDAVKPGICDLPSGHRKREA
jgi:hypothetical protein